MNRPWNLTILSSSVIKCADCMIAANTILKPTKIQHVIVRNIKKNLILLDLSHFLDKKGQVS